MAQDLILKELKKADKKLKASDLQFRLNISRGSVDTGLRKLKKWGFVDWEYLNNPKTRGNRYRLIWAI